MSESAIVYDAKLKFWLRFANPIETFSAHAVGQVIPILNQLEDRVEREQLYAVGFISYEAAPAFDPALTTQPHDDFPLLHFSLFRSPQKISRLPKSADLPALDWQPGLDSHRFAAAVARIHDWIASGATYQVNLTFPLTTRFDIDPEAYFLRLVENQQPPGAGYLNAGRWAVCSASPELFFQRDGKLLTMRPMKGTAARGRTLAEDRAQAESLRNSVKNQAENVMILDMVRNDLGRIAPPGTVMVDALYSLEKYPTVWQLTSTARAHSDARLVEVFMALFPCASITGAPKAQTMRIIAELETGPRRVYTGTFGWFGPGRQARFNVAIRTALFDKQTYEASYGVGAGITWDSDPLGEYRECLDKAAILSHWQPEFALLETLRWSPTKGYFLLEQHIDRLRDSAAYFDYPFVEANVRSCLDALANSFGKSRHRRVRLLLDSSGQLHTRHAAIDDRQWRIPLQVRLADTPVDSSDRFLYHKTTHREVYDRALAEAHLCDEVLLINERGEVTEFSIGNLVAELGDRRVTPPVRSGLLPGTYRQDLLDRGIITEQVMTPDDLRHCKRLFLVNAVRKWQRVFLMHDM